MEKFIRDQLVATLKYAPFHIAAGCLKKTASPAAEECRRKLGCRFVKGICHPSEDFEKVRGAGLEWNRVDIAFPFDAQGNIRQEYLDGKEKMRRYRENGIRIMEVTPYPREFIKYGIDPRTPEGEARVREVAVFLLGDLRGLADAFQITNEMGLPHMMQPLDTRQAARFIGVQLEAMHSIRGDILLGYNSAGPQADLHALMRPWHRYCDYVGIDIYIGCFVAPGSWMRMYDALLRYLWSMTGKPILLCEFGYISGGAPKTPEEKRAVLRRYGVSSEAEARENAGQFLERLKALRPVMYERVMKNASGAPLDFLFRSFYKNHFYSELPRRVAIKKYPHTPAGQADFYRDIFPRLAKLPFVLGAFIYKWNDKERCSHCGQEDCPTESRWGIVDRDGNEKPGYYAVRDALEKIK